MATRLDRAQVVDTALRLLNEVGFDGLTLRRIAKELNVQAPALYWHFTNKQELLDEMATEMFRRMDLPANAREAGLLEADADWRDWIRVTCRALRRSLLGYRDGAKVFSGTRFTDMGHVGAFETYLGALVDAGFPLRDAVQALFTASSFTIGFVIEEQSVYPVPGEKDPHYDEAERAYRVGEEFPLSADAGQSLFSDYDARFETGLRIVVAGIEQVLLPTKR